MAILQRMRKEKTEIVDKMRVRVNFVVVLLEPSERQSGKLRALLSNCHDASNAHTAHFQRVGSNFSSPKGNIGGYSTLK